MQCQKFENRLNDVLDARESPGADADLAAHAKTCGSCGEMLIAAEKLLDGVDCRPSPEPPDDLTDRVLDEFVRGRPAIRWNWSVVIGAAIAASLLIAAIPWLLDQFKGTPENPGNTPIADSPDSPQSLIVAVDTRDGTPLVLTTEEYVAMLRLTGAEMARLPHTVRQATVYEDGAVAGRIRPVTNSVTAVWGALRGTLPSKTAGEES